MKEDVNKRLVACELEIKGLFNIKRLEVKSDPGLLIVRSEEEVDPRDVSSMHRIAAKHGFGGIAFLDDKPINKGELFGRLFESLKA